MQHVEKNVFLVANDKQDLQHHQLDAVIVARQFISNLHWLSERFCPKGSQISPLLL